MSPKLCKTKNLKNPNISAGESSLEVSEVILSGEDSTRNHSGRYFSGLNVHFGSTVNILWSYWPVSICSWVKGLTFLVVVFVFKCEGNYGAPL